MDIFEGKHLPLRLGYIGIVNRSQKDINGKISIDDALKKEKEYFDNSPYKSLMHRMGARFLQETLNKQLTNHINEKLPSIRSKLQAKICTKYKKYSKTYVNIQLYGHWAHRGVY